MVPYRVLAGCFDKAKETVDWGSVKRMTAYIERINKDVVLLPYTLGESSKLKKEIHFQASWLEMIYEKEGIRKRYEACYRDNIHSIWANQEL